MEVNLITIALVCVVACSCLIAIVVMLQAVGIGAVYIWSRLPLILQSALFKAGWVILVAMIGVAIIVNLIMFITNPAGYFRWVQTALNHVFDLPNCPLCF